MTSIYDFKVTEMNGDTIDFNHFQDKVILIVNTASRCGLAGQLKELETLYLKYHNKGLEVIGFPSNQFHRELKDSNDIQNYCRMHYGVTFPMTKLVKVNGEETTPLFAYLKKVSSRGPIKFNYTKFLIGRGGQLIHRYAPITSPKKIEKSILKALK